MLLLNHVQKFNGRLEYTITIIPFHHFRKSHCGDKTILRPSYLHNGIS